MYLTAGLLTHNDETYLKRCLETLARQEGIGKQNRDWMIVIRDNASTNPDYLREAQRRFPEATFVFGKENVGFSRGHNEIIRRFPADYHAVLNNDVLFSKTYLVRLIEALEKHPECGSVTGKLLHWDIEGKEERTNIIDSAGIVTTVMHAWKDRGQGTPDRGQYDREEQVFGGSGAAIVFRRSALEKIEDGYGFFDERIFMYKEDCDLAERLNAANLHCRYVPEAVAWHARTAGGVVRRSARSVNERAQSAAHETFVVRKHRKRWPPLVRILASLRQQAKRAYLSRFERDVWQKAVTLRKNLIT